MTMKENVINQVGLGWGRVDSGPTLASARTNWEKMMEAHEGIGDQSAPKEKSDRVTGFSPPAMDAAGS
ncbi:hypothetical protein TNCT_338271 [Trichonephila clavata]|uniref:Uncharacterized protein n=1 Tax=Trichonephila clavata TaxID=2740835 RepID=A0A8X6GX35_TRICU|nr:hypothetical protein TNCT_338271 [Trichonephila clavata]